MSSAVVPSRTNATAAPPLHPTSSSSPSHEEPVTYLKLTLLLNKIQGESIQPPPTRHFVRWLRNNKQAQTTAALSITSDGIINGKMSLYARVKRPNGEFVIDQGSEPLETTMELISMDDLPNKKEKKTLIATYSFDMSECLASLIDDGIKSMVTTFQFSNNITLSVKINIKTLGQNYLKPYHHGSSNKRLGIRATTPRSKDADEAEAALQIQRLRQQEHPGQQHSNSNDNSANNAINNTVEQHEVDNLIPLDKHQPQLQQLPSSSSDNNKKQQYKSPDSFLSSAPPSLNAPPTSSTSSSSSASPAKNNLRKSFDDATNSNNSNNIPMSSDVSVLQARVLQLEQDNIVAKRDYQESERKIVAHVLHINKVKETYTQLALWYNTLRQQNIELQQKIPTRQEPDVTLSTSSKNDPSPGAPLRVNSNPSESPTTSNSQEIRKSDEGGNNDSTNTNDTVNISEEKTKELIVDEKDTHSALLESKARSLEALRTQWDSTQTTLKLKEEEAIKHKQELSEVRQNLETLKSEHERSVKLHEEQITKIEREHSEKFHQIDRLHEDTMKAKEEEMKKVREEHEKILESETEKSLRQLEELKAESKQWKECTADFEGDIKNLNLKLKVEKENHDSQVAELTKEIENHELSCKNIVIEKEALDAQLRQQQQDQQKKETYTKEMDAEFRERIEVLEKENDELKSSSSVTDNTASTTPPSPSSSSRQFNGTDASINDEELKKLLRIESDKRRECENLLQKIEQEQEETRELVSRIRSERDVAQNEIQELTNQLASATAQGVQNNSYVEVGMQEELSEARDKAIFEVFKVRKELTKKIRELTKENKTLEVQSNTEDSSLNKLNELERKLSENEQQVEEFGKEKLELMSRIEKVEVETMNKDYSIGKLNERIDKEIETGKEYKMQIQKLTEIEKMFEKNVKKTTEIEKELGDQVEKARDLENEYEKQVIKSKDMEEEYEKQVVKSKDIEEKYEKQVDKSKDMEKEYDAIKKQRDEIKDRCAALDETLQSEMMKRNENENMNNDEREVLKKKLSEEIIARQAAVEESRLNTELEIIVKDLTSEINSKDEEIKQLLQQHEGSERHVVDLRNETNGLKKDIGDLQDEINGLKNETGDLNKRLNAKDGELNEVKGTRDELVRKVGRLEVEVKRLKNELGVQDETVLSISHERDDWEREAKQIDHALKDVTQQLNIKNEESKDVIDRKNEVEKQVQSLEITINELKEELDVKDEELKQIEDDRNIIEDEISKYESSINDVNENMRRKEEELKKVREQVEDFKGIREEVEELREIEEEAKELREINKKHEDVKHKYEKEKDQVHKEWRGKMEKREYEYREEKSRIEKDKKKMLNELRLLKNGMDENVKESSNLREQNEQLRLVKRGASDEEHLNDLIMVRLELAECKGENGILRNQNKKLEQRLQMEISSPSSSFS